MKWLKMLWTLDTDLHQKSWFTSKTIWFNILTFAAAILATKGINLDSSDLALLGTGLAAAGNIGLRFATKVPVGQASVPLAGGTGVPDGDDPGRNESAP